MAKVLLVDTSFSSGPIYNALLAMGHEVHVVGRNTQDCLAKSCKNYWNIDYANMDAMENLVNEQSFDYLIPGCTDRSYESCVAVSKGRFPGLDSPSANKAVSNKGEFHRLADRLGLPTPRVQDSSRNAFRWPMLIKPVDAFSGKGITIIEKEDSQRLEAAIRNAQNNSLSKQYLIEDFVEGQLYSHTAFLSEKKVLQDFFVQEDRTANPFVVDTSRVVSDFPDELRTSLRFCAEKIASELELVDGLLHTQFIRNGKEFWLIELTRRCPGDLYSQLIELATGYRYAYAYVLPFLNARLTKDEVALTRRYIMRHTLTLRQEQSLGHLQFNCPLFLERWVPLSLVGDQLKPSPHSRIAILFCSAQSDEDLDVIYQRALQRKLYDVRG